MMLAIFYVIIAFAVAMLALGAVLLRAAVAVDKAVQRARDMEDAEENERLNNEFRRMEEESRMRPYTEHSVYLGP